MNKYTDTELLDLAELFCKQRGGEDRFATLGLSLGDQDQQTSLREALSALFTMRSSVAKIDAAFGEGKDSGQSVPSNLRASSDAQTVS